MVTAERVEALRENLAAMRDRIKDAAQAVGRDPDEITLMGATKAVPSEVIVEAIRLGLTEIGENWVQEAAPKVAAVTEALVGSGAAARLHMIGHLQGNKVRQAIGVFDAIDTVDSLRIATDIDRRASAAGKQIDVLLEIDYTDDPERGGFRLGIEHDQGRLDSLFQAAEGIMGLKHVRVAGLMTVAPQTEDPEGARPAFRRLRDLQQELQSRFGSESWRELSTGMSHDYRVAIQEGATYVRIGTAIFGQRPPGRTY